ncbi:helix-turn-helix transcriptional regulator [Natroniella acetigena]|uniref:helix-turn-helix domain-containing protein n=1 Tax=Natroniella acetigena TaxID=52004 RepID=UPI00200ABAC3|nr:helix-turn-helix transcriptional regulator [Natroniella acetigena]MCK8826376.1 helix-turn-helix transcriptional regulator [Natroniella acetigena]
MDAKVQILKELMEINSWSQTDVGKIVNCSRSLVSQIINEDKSPQWFWEQLAKETNCYELHTLLVNEKLMEVVELVGALSKKKSTPARNESAVAI